MHFKYTHGSVSNADIIALLRNAECVEQIICAVVKGCNDWVDYPDEQVR